MTEEWRPIGGYEGLYEVSSLGRVLSLHRVPRMLSTAATDETGYPVVALSREGKRHTYTLHRLVCKAFHGPSRPVHREVAHLDGDKKNARADNLKWVSKVENESHKRLHGTRAVGQDSPSAKLTDADVRAILLLLADGVGCRVAGEKYGVKVGAVEAIRRRRNWRHIVGPPAAYEKRPPGSRSGEQNPAARLSVAQAAEIRRSYIGGESAASLLRRFNVSKATVYRIISGTSYRAKQRDAQTPSPSQSKDSPS